MQNRVTQSFKHISRTGFLLSLILAASNAFAEKSGVDLIDAGTRAWESVGTGWNIGDSDITLIVTYRKDSGYPAGPIQIRLTNASARIHGLVVEFHWID